MYSVNIHLAMKTQEKDRMVFFVLTRSGHDELLLLLGKTPSPLWVNEGVLSKEETKLLHEVGVEISNFTHRITIDDFSQTSAAIDTIKQHHPNHSIWVENPASL
jgi:hypothetical protein